jgi:hypothetical protein
MLTLYEGRFVAPALASATPTRMDCSAFHAALASFRLSPLSAEITPTDIRFKTSLPEASLAFLAKSAAEESVPVIGRGRVSGSIEASSPRTPDSALIDQVSISGLQFATTVIPNTQSYRSLANDLGRALALPDFLSPEQQQLKAIEDTADALSRLSGASSPDVLAHIPAIDLKLLADQKLEQLGLPKLIGFGFGKQEILAYVPAARANSLASVILHLAVSIGDTYVSVRPSISFAALASFRSSQIGEGKKTPDQIMAFLEKQLAPVVTPLTSGNTEIKIPIPTNDVVPLDLTKRTTDARTGATIDVKSLTTAVTVSVPQRALLIDSDGLHLLAHVGLQ